MSDKLKAVLNILETNLLTLYHQQTVVAQKGTKRVHLVTLEPAENVACENTGGNIIPSYNFIQKDKD